MTLARPCLAALLLCAHLSAQGAEAPLFDLVNRSSADPKKIRALLALGADPNARGHDRRTPLLAAVRYNNLAAVRVLLDAGADVNRRGDSETPLCASIKGASVDRDDMVLLLLRRGADPNLSCAQRHSPLRAALIQRSYDVAVMLVKAGARANDTDADGQTMLMNAAIYGPWRMVDLLIDGGAEVDARDGGGRTALMRAVNVSVAAALIRQGADVNARNARGDSVLALHLLEGRKQVAALLRRHGALE